MELHCRGYERIGIVDIPLLSKEGWLRASKKWPRSLTGAAGVVLIRYTTTPAAPAKVASRYFSWVAATPPWKGGNAPHDSNSFTPSMTAPTIRHLAYSVKPADHDLMKVVPEHSKKPLAFPALRDRNFRFFFAGTMLAMMAHNIAPCVSYWLLFQKFHSPVLAGFADISHWTPFLLLSVYFGGIADRHDCRKVIQVAQLLFMGVSAAWAILFFTNTIQVWHGMVLLIIHGIAGVIWGPAEQVLIHDIVDESQLRNAVRLNATSRQLGILFGPAVGSALMWILGPPMALVVNVAIYLPLTIWLRYFAYT